MAVQEFMLDEVKDIVNDTEKAVEWNALVDKLGLEGQRKLCSADPTNPIPFPLMNREMLKVYETLCETKALLKDYSKTTIPTRVLEIAGLCVIKEYFGKIEVWYDEHDPDPVLVGCDGEDKYLLARWGAELEEYAILRQEAVNRLTKKAKNVLTMKLHEIQNGLPTVDAAVEAFISGTTSYLHIGGEYIR